MLLTATCQLQDALILASPAVRRVAREHNVELADVTGTGSGGRITQGETVLHAPAPAYRVIVTHDLQQQVCAVTPSMHQSKQSIARDHHLSDLHEVNGELSMLTWHNLKITPPCRRGY